MSDARVTAWSALTTDEARALAAQDPVVVLPVAAVEQHGPHLPLSTDLDIGLGLLDEAFGRLPSDLRALALPPVAVGTSREHARFPGTLGVDADVLVEIVRQQGEAVAGAGVRRLVLANSHGGNMAALDVAALRLREACAMLVVKASYFLLPRPRGVTLPDGEWSHGWHGGAVETAMMLHLRPDLVRTDRLGDMRPLGADLERRLSRVGPDAPGASFAWLAGDLHPSGAVGDATLATAAMGATLVDHYGAALADVIRDAAAFPLERLSGS